MIHIADIGNRDLGDYINHFVALFDTLGGTLEFSARSYQVTTPVRILGKKNIFFEFHGAVLYVQPEFVGPTVFQICAPGLGARGGIHIRDVNIIGSKNVTVNAVSVRSTNHISLSNVNIEDFSAPGSIGVLLVNAMKCNFSEVHVESAAIGVRIDSTSNLNNFRGTRIRKCTGHGLFITNSSLNSFLGCLFESNPASVCITVGSFNEYETSFFNSLTSCWFENNGDGTKTSSDLLLRGSKAYRPTGTVIEDCFFGSNSQGHPSRGIVVDNEFVEGTRIENNMFHANYEKAIDARRSSTTHEVDNLTSRKGNIPGPLLDELK